MNDERVAADLQGLWQGQPADAGTMSLEDLRRGSRRLERRVGRRNAREYIAAIVVVIVFGWTAWIAPTATLRLAAGLIAAGAIFIAYHLSRHGAARTMPADLGLTSCLQFHRGELVRQRDLLRGVWTWALLPCAPGLILFYLGQLWTFPAQVSRIGWSAAATVVVFVFLGALNRRAANKIQSRIDALERNP
jgi:hypothetical protein